MKAYRIQNAIVAAYDPDQAIATWAEETGERIESAGPVEELSPSTPIDLEDEDGGTRPGTIADALAEDGAQPYLIAFGECENCD